VRTFTPKEPADSPALRKECTFLHEPVIGVERLLLSIRLSGDLEYYHFAAITFHDFTGRDPSF